MTAQTSLSSQLTNIRYPDVKTHLCSSSIMEPHISVMKINQRMNIDSDAKVMFFMIIRKKSRKYLSFNALGIQRDSMSDNCIIDKAPK
jgi:hypothetical protein